MPAARPPSATVVIPTFNRLDELTRVLEAVARQDAPEGCSVTTVVVDDGSTDGTWPWLLSARRRLGLVAIRQENSGPARARNVGVEAAPSDLILFLGDDTVPQEGWLMHHLEEHRLRAGGDAVAVLGYTSFPAAQDSQFLRQINEYGAQFGYSLIEDVASVPFNYFYTSNVSLPREVLVRLGGFREDFPAAAWEDIEFAYRATRQGLRLVYQPRARVVHHHQVGLRAFCCRQRTAGFSGAIFARLHPELEAFLGVELALGLRRWSGLEEWLLGRAVALGQRLPGVVPGRVVQKYVELAYHRGLAAGLSALKRENEGTSVARAGGAGQTLGGGL